MIKKLKLSKFNSQPCENLYIDIRYINSSNLMDITNLYNRVVRYLDNKKWLKYRDELYLMNVLDKGGFIIGCYIEETLIACALCEVPSNNYLDYLYEIGFDESKINSSYVSGYVMVDPLYRGNSLHKILMEIRIEESLIRGKNFIITAIANDNIFSLNTILNLGFEFQFEKKNEYNITRSILTKQLVDISKEEFTA